LTKWPTCRPEDEKHFKLVKLHRNFDWVGIYRRINWICEYVLIQWKNWWRHV
jgi:hypothetical protein